MRTKMASLSAMVLICVSTLWLGLTFFSDTAIGSTLYVGGFGSGNYSTIQIAVDASNPGDTVYVYGGRYYEHVVINKTLTMRGESRDTTIIDGSENGPVINVTADWVNISGFNITNGGTSRDTAGIVLYHSQNCHLSDNIISKNGNGIWLSYSSNSVVTGNHIFLNKWDGIQLRPSSSGNEISENTIHDNWAGIALGYSSGNTIIDNEMFSESYEFYDDLYGISIGGSDDNTISRNSISEMKLAISIIYSNNTTVRSNSVFHNRWGISLFHSNYSSIDNNTIRENSEGIGLGSSDNNIISNNMIYENSDGIHLGSSNANRIYHNEFTDNQYQAYDHNGTNQWDNGYPSGGNYWSDYSAYDWFSGSNQNELGGDGIGDSPRQIESGSCKDRYPILVGPPKSILAELWFWSALVLILIVCGLAVFLLVRRKKKREEEPTDEPIEEELEN